jgi:hypothetical protein
MINSKKRGIARPASPPTYIILFLVSMLQLQSYSAHAETMNIAQNCDKSSMTEMLKEIEARDKQKGRTEVDDVSTIVQQHIFDGCDVVGVITGLTNAGFKLSVSKKHPGEVFATIWIDKSWLGISFREFVIIIEYLMGRVKSVSGTLYSTFL